MPTRAIIIVLIIIIVITIVIVSFALLNMRTDAEIKTLRIPSSLKEHEKKYSEELLELLSIQVYGKEGRVFLPFREKLQSFFPLIHEKMNRKVIGSFIIFTYFPQEKEKNILFVVNNKKDNLAGNHYMDANEIYGEGTYNCRSLMYVTFRAVEEILAEEKNLNIGVSIIVSLGKENLEANSDEVVNYFLQQGLYFDLVIKEGISIIDPSFLGLKSHFAIIGNGTTGEFSLRYKVQKTDKSKERLNLFINELQTLNLFKTKIDAHAKKLLSSLAFDMDFFNRLIFSNLFLTRFIAKIIIKNDQTELSLLLKTTINIDKLEEDDKCYFCDVTFQLSQYDEDSDIIKMLSSLVQKYELEYEVKSIKKSSNLTDVNNPMFRLVTTAVEETFKDLYVIPHMLINASLDIDFNNLSEAVVWINPIYYPEHAKSDAKNNKEHVMKKSIAQAINLYKAILRKSME